MDVTDVLRDRMQEPGSFETTAAALSVFAHGAFIAIMLLSPGLWGIRPVQEPKTVMTITLGGGAPGPTSGGLTSEGGRPVQEMKPADEAPRPEALRPPAAKTPEMTLPEKNAKPQKSAAPVKEAPADARGRTPTRGDETSPGSAAAYTGARGAGFGLSTGGPLGAGSYLDVGDFCCPEYLALVKLRIESGWNSRTDVAGEVVVKFTIQRNGTITDTTLEQSSGNAVLDLNAERAVHVTKSLAPLPAAFPNPTLTVHYNFQYHR